MDRRKDHLSKRVAHLPDLPYKQSGNAGKPVRARRHETNGLYRTENSSESRMDSANVPLKVAKIIYESEFWASTNFKWLFSELVPVWFETDPEDWPVVRRILQEFIHRDFVRQYSRVKEHVEPRQAELNVSECVSHAPIGDLLDSSPKSYNATGKMQNKKNVEHGTDRVRRSISLQSLDDLLDEVLEEEEASERRRRKKNSAQSEPDNKLGKSWFSAEVPDKVVVQKDQPTSKGPRLNETAIEKEEFGGSTRNITSPLNDDILQILDELDADWKPKHKNKRNTGKPQIELTKDDRNEQLLKEHCRMDMNRLEHSKRPKSRRGFAEPRSPLDNNYKSQSTDSMHRNDPEKLGAIANLSSASIGSEETFESYVSTENRAASHQAPVRQNDSNSTYTIEVDANCECSNSNITICDTGHNQRCEHVQVNIRPRRRKRILNVIKRNLSYFRRKLKSINCCSNSID